MKKLLLLTVLFAACAIHANCASEKSSISSFQNVQNVGEFDPLEGFMYLTDVVLVRGDYSFNYNALIIKEKQTASLYGRALGNRVLLRVWLNGGGGDYGKHGGDVLFDVESGDWAWWNPEIGYRCRLNYRALQLRTAWYFLYKFN